jgi:hypothetical protein
MNIISNKQKASLVGVLILVAYSMLLYSITKNIPIGVITDIVSGSAVIGIPLLMFPIFNAEENKKLNYAYLVSRIIEGILMIIGGIIILNPSLEKYREVIYRDVHIYFFILGALFFYILFYRTQVIPRFISIWGILATIILFVITIIKLFRVDSTILNALLLPMILNELFLAFWLIIKGFNFKTPAHLPSQA